jgi:hypothetical protein
VNGQRYSGHIRMSCLILAVYPISPGEYENKRARGILEFVKTPVYRRGAMD